MKSARLHAIAILTAGLVLMSGFYYSVPAGQGNRFTRTNRVVTRDTGISSTPSPVVDDTPINPDTFSNTKGGIVPKNDKPVKPMPKRRVIRR